MSKVRGSILLAFVRDLFLREPVVLWGLLGFSAIAFSSSRLRVLGVHCPLLCFVQMLPSWGTPASGSPLTCLPNASEVCSHVPLVVEL